MDKRDQEQIGEVATYPMSESFPESMRELDEPDFILYLCEDMRVAKREVVPILTSEGYQVRVAKVNPQRSLNLLCDRCQLVLVDIGIPDAIGYRICAQIRSISHMPIMLILRGSARSDVLRGFEVGADTFVQAPFPTREFVVRLQALLRRRPLRRIRPSLF